MCLETRAELIKRLASCPLSRSLLARHHKLVLLTQWEPLTAPTGEAEVTFSSANPLNGEFGGYKMFPIREVFTLKIRYNGFTCHHSHHLRRCCSLPVHPPARPLCSTCRSSLATLKFSSELDTSLLPPAERSVANRVCGSQRISEALRYKAAVMERLGRKILWGDFCQCIHLLPS